MLKRVITRVGIGIGALLFLIAADCGKGGGPVAPGNDVNAPEMVKVSVQWGQANRPNKHNIEISYTFPGRPTKSYQQLCCRETFLVEFPVLMKVGDRVSITGDQNESGFLSCSIHNGMSQYAYEHRNDPGSVHCEWTKKKQQHALTDATKRSYNAIYLCSRYCSDYWAWAPRRGLCSRKQPC